MKIDMQVVEHVPRLQLKFHSLFPTESVLTKNSKLPPAFFRISFVTRPPSGDKGLG